MTEGRSRVARMLVWTGLESGLLAGLSILSLFVFARLLSPGELGTFAIALGIVQLICTPTGLFQDALVQRLNADDLHFDTAMTASLLLAGLLVAFSWTFSDVITQVSGIAAIGPVFFALSLTAIPLGIISVLEARLRRALDFRPLAMRTVAGRVLGVGVGIIAAFFGAGLWALVLQQFVILGCGAAVLWAMAEYRPRLRFSPSHFRDLFYFGISSIGVIFVEIASPRVFMLLLGISFGPVVVGYFDLASRAVDMFRAMAARAVLQLALPLFSRFGSDRPRFWKGYTEATHFTSLLTFPIFTGIAICAPEFVELLFGPSWLPSAPIVTILGVLALPYFARLYSVPGMAALGKPQAALAPYTLELAIVIVGMLTIGTISLGWAVGVWVLRVLFALPLELWLFRRISGMPIAVQLHPALPAAAATAMMMVGVLVLKVTVFSEQPLLLRFAAMAFAGAAIYISTIFVIDLSAITRLLDFGRSVLKRQATSNASEPA